MVRVQTSVYRCGPLAIVLIGSLLCNLGHGQLTSDEQIAILQQQINQLQADASGTKLPVYSQPRAANHLHGVPSVPPEAFLRFDAPPYATAHNSGPPPAKKLPDVNLTGFFHLDAAYFGQSAESRATLGDIQDGAGFRRARLAATGNVTERGSYMLEFDMAQGQARFVDVWGQIKDTPLGNLRIGRFRQPFGMAELTSIRELPLMERPSIFALAPFRQTGIMLSNSTTDASSTWAVSGFRAQSDNFGNVYGDHSGYGFAERLTWLPVDGGDQQLIHFGLDHSYLDPARDQLQIVSQDEVFVGQQPTLGPGGLSVLPLVGVPPFVNTGVFDVDHANLFNLEGAVSLGRAVVQSEYRWNRLSLPTGESTTVHGGYLTLRYVLSGEIIAYNRANGVFGDVKPDCPLDVKQGHWGAWEVVGQWSSLDLNPLFGLPGVTGPTRRLTSGTLGLNWYWWDNAKCQFEWINGSLNDPALSDSVSNTLASRLQFDF
ncbi:MAG: porin [Planctomycetales bacterium]|nr:porin [Planctomycetales bacterium]